VLCKPYPAALTPGARELARGATEVRDHDAAASARATRHGFARRHRRLVGIFGHAAPSLTPPVPVR
jgi:hypothetical protein